MPADQMYEQWALFLKDLVPKEDIPGLIARAEEQGSPTAPPSGGWSSMDRERAVLVAKLYFALSSLGDWDGLRDLFAPEVVAYGVSGREAVLTSMRDFHSKHEEVFWRCLGVRDPEPLTASPALEVPFRRFWRGEDGRRYQVDACDRITFTADLRISSIAYVGEPSEPSVCRTIRPSAETRL
jgi:ketosteroid isomerase-like protein